MVGRRHTAHPGGWITTTARNRAIDPLRRDARERELHEELAMFSPTVDDAVPADTAIIRTVKDDL